MSITSVIRGCFLGVTLILSSSSAISQRLPTGPGGGPGVDAPGLSHSSIAAQLVAGEGGGVRYSTTVTAKNRSGETCDIWGKIFRGGGRTTISALDLNGQRLPTSGIFNSTVAPNGIQVYELKQPPQVSGINLFAGKFQTDKNCGPHVDFSVQYFINGGIDDAFSYGCGSFRTGDSGAVERKMDLSYYGSGEGILGLGSWVGQNNLTRKTDRLDFWIFLLHPLQVRARGAAHRDQLAVRVARGMVSERLLPLVKAPIGVEVSAGLQRTQA